MILQLAERKPQEVVWEPGVLAWVHWDNDASFLAEARRIHAVIDGEDYGMVDAWVDLADSDHWWQDAPDDPYCFGTEALEPE